jgi:hypothetical protein
VDCDAGRSAPSTITVAGCLHSDIASRRLTRLCEKASILQDAVYIGKEVTI